MQFPQVAGFQGEGQWTGNDWGIISEENRFRHMSVLKFQARIMIICVQIVFSSPCATFYLEICVFSCCFKAEYNSWPIREFVGCLLRCFDVSADNPAKNAVFHVPSKISLKA